MSTKSVKKKHFKKSNMNERKIGINKKEGKKLRKKERNIRRGFKLKQKK